MKVRDLIAALSAAPQDNDIAVEIDGPAWSEIDVEFRGITIKESDPPGLTIIVPE